MADHHLAVWEFQVKHACIEEFERVYGSSGPWAALFRKSPEYLGTELIRDSHRPGRYLTIDRWTSLDAFVRFKRDHAVEYGLFDEECERLTITEKLIGNFESPTLPASAPSQQP